MIRLSLILALILGILGPLGTAHAQDLDTYTTYCDAVIFTWTHSQEMVDAAIRGESDGSPNVSRVSADARNIATTALATAHVFRLRGYDLAASDMVQILGVGVRSALDEDRRVPTQDAIRNAHAELLYCAEPEYR